MYACMMYVFMSVPCIYARMCVCMYVCIYPRTYVSTMCVCVCVCV